MILKLTDRVLTGRLTRRAGKGDSVGELTLESREKADLRADRGS